MRREAARNDPFHEVERRIGSSHAFLTSPGALEHHPFVYLRVVCIPNNPHLHHYKLTQQPSLKMKPAFSLTAVLAVILPLAIARDDAVVSPV